MPKYTPKNRRRYMKTLLVLVLLSWATSVAAAGRAAFVVGNSNYDNAPSLSNPIRDSRLVAETLERLGFDVTRHEDLTRDVFAEELEKFLQLDADVSFFYFAGHGMQFDGQNYLVGTDANLRTELDIDSETIALAKVVDLIERKSNAALVFVDACRGNPIATNFYRRNFSETRALETRGLARMQPRTGGSMLVFAAAPGQLAYDGEGPNSPFAQALAKHLPTEGVEILSLTKRIRGDVFEATHGRQSPIVTNDLTREIFLASPSDPQKVAVNAPQESAPIPGDETPEKTIAATPQVVDVPRVLTEDTAKNPELSAAQVRVIQHNLNRLGYRAGPEDGVFGPRTKDAISAFQSKEGIKADGEPSDKTVTLLALAESGLPEQSSIRTRDGGSGSSEGSVPETSASLPSTMASRLAKVKRVFPGKELIAGEFDGRLYVIVLTWDTHSIAEGRRLARRAGGYLASIGSVGEQKFLMNLALSDGRLWSKDNYGHTHGPSIGLFQLDGSREPNGGWVWDSGERVTYRGWTDSQPDNARGVEHTSELWIQNVQGSNARRYGWNDKPEIYRSFIIEIP